MSECWVILLVQPGINEVNLVISFSGLSVKIIHNYYDKTDIILVSMTSVSLCVGGSVGPVEGVLKVVQSTLNVLADSVLQEQPPVRRKKLEHLVSEEAVICQ